MRNLDNIHPLDGTQEYLLRNWIPESEFAKVKTDNGTPDVYHDGTYDWYGGFARAVHPETILEIGVYRGYSLAAMLKGAAGSVMCAFCVDNGQEGGLDVVREALGKIQGEFMPTRTCLVPMDTQELGISGMFTENPNFDLIHIDADHSYEGCLNDLKNFAPLVSENGLVIVHDSKDEPVMRACMDFIADYPMDWREIDTVKGNIIMARK